MQHLSSHSLITQPLTLERLSTQGLGRIGLGFRPGGRSCSRVHRCLHWVMLARDRSCVVFCWWKYKYSLGETTRADGERVEMEDAEVLYTKNNTSNSTSINANEGISTG